MTVAVHVGEVESVTPLTGARQTVAEFLEPQSIDDLPIFNDVMLRVLTDRDESIFLGGPVETDALIALAYATQPVTEATDELSPVSGRVASADLTTDPLLLAGLVDSVRIFRGYAGWGPGQLEDEIDSGAWLVLDAEPDDVFAPEPDELWRSVLRRQGGRLAWLASAPDDLSAN